MNNSSDLYKKSKSSKYRRYFSQKNDIINEFARYHIGTMECESPHVFKQWERGVAGVPVFWDPITRTVYNDNTDTHTLVIGPTGSKKSRLIAMPQVRIIGTAKENMIITDPKAEIYRRTASFLESQGYTIRVINLRTPDLGDMWNPLLVPYKYYCNGDIDRAYEFVNDIAENLMHSSGEHNNDPFWENSAASFLFGLAILLFKYCKEKDLPEKYVTIQNLMRLGDKLLSQKPREAKDKPSILWRYAKTDQIIENNLVGTIETAEDTRGGIISVFKQKMRIFSIQPNLMKMLSSNSFQLDEMENMPTAIFLILPDEKTGYHGIASLFIKQSYEYLIYLAQMMSNEIGTPGSLNRRVNYIIDEFASLPTIHDFPALITAARSRNIRFTLIIQSKHQLLQRYKEETDTIMTNCANWIVLTCRENSFLEEISAICGRTEESPSFPIITPDSIQRLDKDTGEALLLAGRKRPFVTHLPDIDKYDDGVFAYRELKEIRKEDPPVLSFFEEEEKEEEEQKKHKLSRERFEFDKLLQSMKSEEEIK